MTLHTTPAILGISTNRWCASATLRAVCGRRRAMSTDSSLSVLLTLLSQCKTLRSLKQIHAHALTTHTFIDNHLLSKLVSLRDLRYSKLLFSRIPSPNDFSFNVMIRGLATSWHDYPLALTFHRRMLRSSLRPNHFTFPFVLIAAANLPSPSHGRAAHASITVSGLASDHHTRHSLITMYARCGHVESARQVFDGIPDRDLVSWSSMISGYAKMGFPGEAVGLFRDMQAAGIDPNEMTLVSVLAACADLGDLGLGASVEDMLVCSCGLEMNSFMGSALIGMYAKCGDLVAARRVFDGLPERDVVVWNAMITGYVQNGQSEEAIVLFRHMRDAQIELDAITMVGVLSACASIGALELGTWVDGEASRRGMYSDVYVGTALIDMYAKCGDVDRSIQIFDCMPRKNVVSWNAMISALAFNGRGQEAISLFTRMTDEEGAHPNDTTLVALLSACVHSGLVDEGRRWFRSMEDLFGITPKIEHYSCMVDLLARSSHLEEAWDFIEKMPQKPDPVTLGALLCACRNQKNVGVGERIIEQILELEPSNSGNYVTSSRIYASSKRWDDSARLRGLMRERGVVKTPGCSWTEINSQVHEFRSGDSLHLRADEIYQMTSLLLVEMEVEGYTPDIDLV